jgi:predicted nucleic acid-binding Zn finger protein
MKWFAETTDWKDSVPNGIYLLDDSKTKMYAFKPRGTGEIKMFKNAIKIETRGRKFIVNPVQFKTELKEEEPQGRFWIVKGSKGDEYKVTELNGNYSCTCSGFKFRGDCKHAKSVQVAV